MDVLGIPRAHLVGASLGGQVAQIIATEHPARVLTLTSMMSWTGARSSGQPAPEAADLFKMPPASTREQAMENAVAAQRIVGSPSYPVDEAEVRERGGLSFDRGGYDPGAVPRQAMAALASGDRTARLATVRVPTLVIHGTADKLVDSSGGRATAAAIPGAQLVLIEGMGHNLPPGLWARIADLIAAHARTVATSR
jgi:pimeloyl-ACP methyl ester carboxylesterase